MTIAIRHGLNVTLAGAPEQRIDPLAASVGRAGFVGSDHQGLRAVLHVAEGDRVAAGAPLYADRARPELIFCAPVSGRVEAISFGARRSLASVVLAIEGDERIEYDSARAQEPEALKALLLASGHWPALRARPFNRIADPAGVPAAIFVTAIDTAPHAPDPELVLAGKRAALERGVSALTRLTTGPVFFCQGAGEDLVPPRDNLRIAKFSGLHPAGLVGTHIAHLYPNGGQNTVWHIGCQDVVAIGAFLESGVVDGWRTLAISGPGMRNPRLVRAPLGADLHELVRPDLGPGQKQILSGPVLGGREGRYLGRYHVQASVLNRPAPRARHWLLDALHRAAAPAPFIPTQAIEHALGPDMFAVPLLRALAIGDAETARRLGCLSLAEEDMALASYVTGGGTDLGQRLRAVLDILEAEA